MLVDSLDFDFLGPGDGAVEPGDREATLEGGAIFGAAIGEIVADIEDDRI